MRIRRVGSAFAAAVILATGAVAPASAMTDNAHADAGGSYPSVVALLFIHKVNGQPDGYVFPYCSGTLIAERVVLTASHCNEGTAEYASGHGFGLGATNDPVLTEPRGDGWVKAEHVVALHPETPMITNPLYKGGFRDDVSVQILNGALPSVDTFPSLPTVGMLDEFQKSKTLKTTDVTVVGYGTEAKVTPANGAVAYPDSNGRRYAVLPTTALDKQWIHQDQNVGKNPDQAGACYGDSGGPSFIEQGNAVVVVGVTSTGDGPCFATNVASRTDTPSAHAFIEGVLRNVPSVVAPG